MKKMFTDDLPHRGKFIDWKNSIGYIVKFIYDNIKGEVKIVDYYKKNSSNYIKVKYKNKNYNINIISFKSCHIGDILGLINHGYKYQVGDIITNIHFGKLQILKQIKIEDGRGWHDKGYEYRCLICGNEDTIKEGSLKNKNGCNVCSNQKVLKGYNDMWTTNPNLAKLLADPNDGYKYMQSSRKYIDWKCPNCGNIIKYKVIYQINKYGLSCPKCSDGISYPEKFVNQFLQQLLQDNFIYQLSKTNFKWCKNYKYDFYFKINNEEYVIETHGLQHYEKSFKNIKGARTLKEEQKNDKLKKKLALKNDIKEDNYIIIDCRHSELEWIKEHILNSRLNELFDLSTINWLDCHKYACSSLVKKACDLWTSGIHNTVEIGKIMKLARGTIIGYLKQGKRSKWCTYNSKEEMIKNGYKRVNKRKVICLNNKKVFNSIKEGNEYYNIKNICANCRNKHNYSGIDPKTGKYLQWQYYDEYLIKPKKLLSNEEVNKIRNIRRKK